MMKSKPPQESKNPKPVVRYEDLVSKTSKVLKLLLSFLGVPIPLESHLNCASKISQSTKRPLQVNGTDPWGHQYPARSAVLSVTGVCDALHIFHYHKLAGEACKNSSI